MRIISQNGQIDVPYEFTAFHVAGNIIRMNMAGDTGKWTMMAEYASPEKAEKVVELLHKEYAGIMPGLIIGNGVCFDEDSVRILNESMQGGAIKVEWKGDVEYHSSLESSDSLPKKKSR